MITIEYHDVFPPRFVGMQERSHCVEILGRYCPDSYQLRDPSVLDLVGKEITLQLHPRRGNAQKARVSRMSTERKKKGERKRER